MPYLKTIVCLANSFKNGGVCIAGKEKLAHGYGGWVRPVSARETEEVRPSECRYKNGADPKLLDIMHVPLLNAAPHKHQTENQVIDTEGGWAKVGVLPKSELEQIRDRPVSLWIDGSNTRSGGWNNCIGAEQAEEIHDSLVLIRPENLAVAVRSETREGAIAKKCWTAFRYNGTHYRLRLTDPIVTKAFQAKNEGDYPFEDVYICVSLTGPYKEDGRCHKLVAAVLSA
jgi:hypothetical protein